MHLKDSRHAVIVLVNRENQMSSTKSLRPQPSTVGLVFPFLCSVHLKPGD